MWSRVFGRSDTPPDPAVLLAFLNGLGLPVTGPFRGDHLGWTGGELTMSGEPPLMLERYLTGEDGLRADLNAWAAWLETREREPAHRPLMERIIGTRQLMTLYRPAEWSDAASLDRLPSAVCRWLAEQTDGVYQVDGAGFFAADGTLLLSEE